MTNLAIFVALGWFWLTFYGVGPLTTWSQVAIGGLCVLVGGVAFALWGAAMGARLRSRRGP